MLIIVWLLNKYLFNFVSTLTLPPKSTTSNLKDSLESTHSLHSTQPVIMNENSPSFKQVCARYLDYICLNTSCHGGNWAMKITSTKLRVFFQFWVIFVSCSMVGAVILQFLTPTPLLETETWRENDGKFPNITICSNRIFDEKKVQGLFLFIL